MSKLESFYWNKLCSKSFFFELEQFFYFCFVLVVQRAALITSSTYDYCVVRQKEFSRKVEMSKVESLYLTKPSNKSFSFQLQEFFYFCFVVVVEGVVLITSSIYNCCVVRQKEFSRKVEMSKVESFYWNKLNNESFSFESEQFLICILFQLFRGVALITSSKS